MTCVNLSASKSKQCFHTGTSEEASQHQRLDLPSRTHLILEGITMPAIQWEQPSSTLKTCPVQPLAVAADEQASSPLSRLLLITVFRLRVTKGYPVQQLVVADHIEPILYQIGGGLLYVNTDDICEGLTHSPWPGFVCPHRLTPLCQTLEMQARGHLCQMAMYEIGRYSDAGPSSAM